MKKLTNEKVQRRTFLKGAAVVGAALGATTSRTLADTTAEAEATEKPLESKGYRETEHIREYYRCARF